MTSMAARTVVAAGLLVITDKLRATVRDLCHNYLPAAASSGSRRFQRPPT
jgi:hypothetical protein